LKYLPTSNIFDISYYSSVVDTVLISIHLLAIYLGPQNNIFIVYMFTICCNGVTDRSACYVLFDRRYFLYRQ